MQFPEDYPFVSDVMAQHRRLQRNVKSFVYEKLTVHLNAGSHTRDLYAKLYQNREILKDLSPAACKIIIHIGCTIEYKAVRVKLPMSEVGLKRKTYYSALLELMTASILRKVEGKKEWYWVNVAVLVVGNVHDT